MAQNKTVAAASEMLSGLKSRLGFAHNDEDEEFSRYDADFDDYDDFDDDYAGDFETDYESYSDRSSSYQAASAGSGRYGRPDSSPNLVSIDDVREHNRSVINSSRGSFEHRSVESAPRRATASGRNFVESSGPAPSSPAYTAAQRDASARSEGLNSLFESTSSSSSRFSSGASAGRRELVVLRPHAYNDVEGIARAVRSGNAVVLAMANTPAALFTRILDFSFGVASALNASVDSPADKVYVIATGESLAPDEVRSLQTQGVL